MAMTLGWTSRGPSNCDNKYIALCVHGFPTTVNSEMYVDLGRTYLAALDGFVMPADLRVVFAKGRVGERLRGLIDWLSSHSTDQV